MTQTIYELDANQRWTGVAIEIDDADAVPESWVAAAEPPPEAGENQAVEWADGDWLLIDLDLITLYQLDQLGQWTGQILEVNPRAGWSAEWTYAAAAPPQLEEGQAALLASGVWHVVDLVDCPAPIEPARRAKRAQLDAIYQVRISANFAWDFGAIDGLDDLEENVGPAGVRSLQIRDLQDQANWTAAHTNAVAAVMVGQPGKVIALKCDDNVWVQTTAAQALVVLTAGIEGRPSLFSRQAANLARYGKLKKLVADAVVQVDLDAIDITAGWLE